MKGVPLYLSGKDPFLLLVRHRRGFTGAYSGVPLTLPSWDSTVIPGGKGEVLKTWTRVVPLNLALAVAGLRGWLPPWPTRAARSRDTRDQEPAGPGMR